MRLEKPDAKTHIKSMNDNGKVAAAAAPETASAADQDAARAWRVVPLEGAYELTYCDQAGNPSTRRVIARELKIGPGKTLLGGIDMANDHYRGFRADRIESLVDGETGEIVCRNVLDWLLKRALRKGKERRRAASIL
jgi:predicted DNA-binding transcriptional regulator YafY